MSESNLNYKNKRILQIIPNMEIGGAERTVLEITSFLKDKEGVMHPWVRCYVHLGEEYDHFISKLKN